MQGRKDKYGLAALAVAIIAAVVPATAVLARNRADEPGRPHEHTIATCC